MQKDIKIWQGDKYSDQRGDLRFVNSFSFNNNKRFYQIIYSDSSIIRTWQGPKLESKYFNVPYGKYLVAWVGIDDWNSPSTNLVSQYVVLDYDNQTVFGSTSRLYKWFQST